MALHRRAFVGTATALLLVASVNAYSSPTYSSSACRSVVGSSFRSSWVGDGYCDNPRYNVASCDWDGGDCCDDTCQNNDYTCGVAGFNCLNPAAGACPSTCEGSYTCDEYQAAGASQTCEFLESEFGCNCAGCDCIPPADPCVDFLGVDCSRYGEAGDFESNLLCFEPDASGLLPQMEACCVCKELSPSHDYLVPWTYTGMQQVSGPPSGVSQSSAMSYFETGYDYPSLDDACVLVDYSSTIFGLSYDDIWVCANGVLSFGEAELAYTPVPIPYSSFPMIAAFWADVDVRCGSGSSLNRIGGCGPNGGNAFGYAIVDTSDTSDPEGRVYSALVAQHIRALYNPDFAATSMLVATWHEVGYYSFQTNKLNSFQVVLVNDDVATGESFACLYFKDIEWSLGQVSGSTHAQVGFDKGDFTTYYAHPDSTTADIADIGSDGAPICYRVDTGEICGPGEVYIDVATGCVPQGCNINSANGAFTDPFLQPATSGGCEFDLSHGQSCALKCVQGRIADSGASMTTTCEAGVLLDPGPQCVSPGIAITPSELDLLEGGSAAQFYVQALTPVYNDPVWVHMTAGNAAAVSITDSSGSTVSTLEFTAENWNVPQAVLVSGVQNSQVAAQDVSTSITFAVASINTAYNSLDLPSVSVNIEDDDYAAIIVDTSGVLAVSETDSTVDACDRSNGATTTIKYALSSQPSGVVTLTFAIAGANAALGQICDTNRLVFTTSNWATPQSLVVAAQSTSIDEPEGLGFSVTGSVGTDDPNYSGLTVAAVSVGFNDNDVSGMSFAASGVRQVFEGGSDVNFALNLDSEPTSTVSFRITLNDTAHCALANAASDGSLTIDVAPALWASDVTFSVAAVDDDTIDPTVTCKLTVASVSSDGNYNGLTATALINKYETDVGGFAMATPSSGYLSVSEGGSSTLGASLTARPTAPVTVSGTVASWDSTVGGEPTVTSVVINPTAWASTNNKLVVSCPENLIHTSGSAGVVNATFFEIVVAISSADANFNALPTQTITAFCEDNDVAGITIATSEVTCGCEAYASGATATSTVLCSKLDAGVLTCVPPSSSTGLCEPDEGTCTASSAGFEGRSITNVFLAEGGDSRTFSLQLLSIPTDPVTLSCTSSDSGRVTVSVPAATLTPDSSSDLTSMVLFVEVSPVADAVDRPTEAFSISCGLTSADEHYNGISRVFIRGAVTDDDVAGITHSPLSAKTYESDTTADPATSTVISVVLDSQPTADVVISASLSSNAPASIVAGATLTFTAANYATPQTVELQGIDDDIAQAGPTAYSVTLDISSASDTVYNSQASISVAMQNLNDDAAGLAVGTSSELTSEDPASPFNPAEFTVALKSEPLSDVEVSCASSDTLIAVCSGTGSVTFTSGNWNTPQTLQVVGVDNDVASADASYSISLTTASSDSNYASLMSSFAMSNLNDDIAGVATTYSTALVTSEDPDTAGVSVCLALESEPTSTVVITASSSNTVEALVNGGGSAALSFGALNWDLAQCVDVSGVRDFIQDGTKSYQVLFSAAASDAAYDGIDVASLNFENLDIDVAGFAIVDTQIVDPVSSARRRLFSVDQSPRVTSEDGVALEIDVVLMSKPAASVVLCGASSDISEGTFPSADGACVTFNAATWNDSQPLTLTGVDDDTVDGPIVYNASIFVSDTTDANYNRLLPKIVSVTNLDNDVAAIDVSRSGFETSEAGASQVISISLTSRPTGSVSITSLSSDESEGVLDVVPLVIAAEDWNTVHELTVTGVADNIDDGDQSYSVSFTVSSTDSNYDGFGLESLSFVNTDDDTAEVLASVNGVQTYESGQGVVRASVSLATQPSADVTISAIVSDFSEGYVSPAQLQFNSTNYAQAQMLTVKGVKDFMVDGNIQYTLSLSSSSSSATEFAGLQDLEFALVNVDEDEAGLVISKTNAFVTEAGGTTSFTVELLSMPSSDVTITVASDDSTEGTVSSGSLLTFTSADWNVTQTVVVQGVDDDLVDGETSFSVLIAASSDDANYDGGNVDTSVTVYNDDDDFASLTFSLCADSTPVVSEGSATTACVEASLSSEPYFDVTVALSADATEAGLSPASLTFTASDWSTPQMALVSSVDDNFQDGSQTYCVDAATTSTDPAYDGLSLCISMTTTDDDLAAVIVSPANEYISIVEGGRGNFSLSLQSEPENGDVTISAAIAPASAAALDVAFFTFTSGNWNVPQHVFYTVSEDSTVSGFGELDFWIHFGSSGSVDPVYAALQNNSVEVVVLENDVAGVSASAASVHTSEVGTSTAVAVSLASVPTNDVTVTCFSTDTTEAVVAPTALVFSDMEPQDLTITGQDDFVMDGAQTYTIACSIGSADGFYDGLFSFNVTGTNSDDDVAGIDVTNTGTTTSEAGANRSFAVRLTSEPVDNVTITAVSSNTGEGDVALPDQLSFSRENWNTSQLFLVQGQDDCVVDGPVAYNATFSSSSQGDSIYDGLAAIVESMTNTDNDRMLIALEASSLRTSEAGACVDVTVSLSARLYGSATFSLTSSDFGEGGVVNGTGNVAQSALMVLDPADYSCAEGTLTFVACGVDDSLDDGDVSYSLTAECVAVADTRDSALVGMDAAVQMVNEDNDSSNVGLSSSSDEAVAVAGGLVTDENGSPSNGGNLFLFITSQPYSAVTATVSCNDTSEVVIKTASGSYGSTAVYTFPAGDGWDAKPQIFYQGVNDNLVDGAQPVLCTTTLSSDDVQYDGLAKVIVVSNLDNDVAGAIATASSAPLTTEAGGSFNVSVVLTAEPFSAVTISASVSDTNQATVSPSSIIVDPSAWNSPVVFTLTGVDNDIVDGTMPYSVSFSTASDDANFAGLAVTSINGETSDDDVGGFEAIAPNPALTGEPNIICCTSTSIEVKLTAEPQEDVVITACSPDLGGREGTVSLSPDSPGTQNVCVDLTFAQGDDWTVSQTVYVTGGNDDIDDDSQDYNIYFSSSSADLAFDSKSDTVGLVNVDDDVATVITWLPASAARVYEGNTSTYGYTIVLNSEPVDDVAIALASDNEAQITVAPASLIFTPSNWDQPQVVSVSSVDNDLDEGDIAASVVATVTSATDAKYNGIGVDDVSVLCVNDDVADIGVALASGSPSVTAEDGSTVTLDVWLTAEPTGTVSLAVAVSDATEAKVMPGSFFVTFTPSDYNVPQQVVVAGVADNMVDGSIYYDVDFSVDSGSFDHAGVAASATYSLSNSDIDVASLLVEAGGSSTVSETGTSTGFLFSLSSKPYNAVTVVAQVSNAQEILASASGRTAASVTISFTPEQWDMQKAIAFIGVDDDRADGPQAVAVSFTLQSEDSDYNGLSVTPVDLTNNDDDVASVDVEAPFSVGVVSESQAGVTFTLVLSSEPYEDVVVNASSTDASVGTVKGSGVFTFTAANWSEPQSVAVVATTTARADRVLDFQVQFEVTSDDDAYDGFEIDNIFFEKIDLTTVGIARSPSASTTYEDPSRDPATIVVSILSQPHADVVIAVASTDTAEGAISPSTLTFTGLNWQTAQVLTVSGVDDNVDDINVDYNITFVVSSTDPDYDGFSIASATFTNVNDDRAGVASEVIGAVVLYEATALNDLDYGSAPQPALCAVLETEPVSDVIATVTNSAPSQAQVGQESFSFTAANWMVQQCITVDPVDDFVADGDMPATITFNFTSADPNYDGVVSQSVSQVYQIVDNDHTGITTSTTNMQITEDETAIVTVALESEPVDTVTVYLTPYDTSEVDVQPAALIFTAADWDVPQEASVLAVHDFVDDGDVVSMVLVSSASADAGYAGLQLNVTIESIDIDVAGLQAVAPTSGFLDVSEEGTQEQFGIVLHSRPLSAVSLTLVTSDSTECVLTESNVVIEPDSWDSQSVVTVVGVDDLIFDQDQPCAVTIQAISSSDPIYNSLNVVDDELLQFTNIDDDVAGIVCVPLAHTTSEATLTPVRSVVTLTSQPLQPVSISYESSDTTEGIASGTIQLDETNWFIGQTVTIYPVDDDLADGRQTYTVDFDPAVSDGADYSGMVPEFSIAIANLDNDTAGVSLKLPGSDTDRSRRRLADTDSATDFSNFAAATCSETNATSYGFELKLTSRPYASVSFTISGPEDPDSADAAFRVMPALANNLSATVDPDNWATWQAVELSCQQDNIATGDFSFYVTFGVESDDPAYANYADDVGLEPPGLAVAVEDADSAGVAVTLGQTGEEDRLETNTTGRSDVMHLRLTSMPFDEVTIELLPKAPGEGDLSADAVVFDSTNWNVSQDIVVTGTDGGMEVAQLYDIGLTVVVANARADVAFTRVTVPAVRVLNQYPSIQVNAGFTSFLDFANSQTGLWVWIAIAVALLILVLLIIIIVVNRQKHKKEIQKEREAAVAARESMLAGADSINDQISWNGDDGIEMGNVDSIRTYEKEYDGIVRKLQREAARLKETNESLSSRARVPPLSLHGAEKSSDVMQLFKVIRELKAANSDVESRADESDSARLLHDTSRKKAKKAVFGQSQI